MIHLLSFADTRMHRSLKRLSSQAKSMGIFDHINFFNENNLPEDFKKTYKDKLILGSRGYGYWSWKPEIIFKSLENMKEGDLLLYVDAGCHLNKSGIVRLREYFQILENSNTGIVAFQSNSPNSSNSKIIYDGRKLFDQPNYEWIKGDLFDHFAVRFDKNFTHVQAIGAGIILIKKCCESLKIINEWRSIIASNFRLIDDTPSISNNLPGFIEHRHDQAIFSLLCLKYKVQTLSSYEYWYPKNLISDRLLPDWGSLNAFPIHARRDKDFGIFLNFKIKIYNLPIRLFMFSKRLFRNLLNQIN